MNSTVPQIDMYGHPQFFATVTKTAACASKKMPDAEQRIIRAASLVLNGQVRAHTVRSTAWIVASESRQDIEYDVVENVCTCDDYARHNRPCKHIISVWLYRRVEQRLAELALPSVCTLPVDQDGTPCYAVQDDCIHEPATVPGVPLATAPTALPEAPASVNVRITLHGREVQWTLRDSDEHRLLDRLEALLQRFPVAQPAAIVSPSSAPSMTIVDGWCTKHDVQMGHNEKNGQTWWSHRADGQWCKGR